MSRKLLILSVCFSFGRFEEPCPGFITCEGSLNPDLCPKDTFYREKVRVHGCCPGCVSLKDEGLPCTSSAQCQPGLKCSAQEKCEEDSSQACELYKRDPAFKANKYWNPNCLPDGTFAPKQCKGEKMSGKCFCVDKTGKRIFGEQAWAKAENMTCACSRLADNMKKTTTDVTFHCDESGNFEPLQCDGKVCWCATPKTGIPYTIMVPLEMMVSLPCYNGNEVGAQYYRQCDSATHMQEVIRSLLRNHGTKEIALASQNCNFDGTYHRVQNFNEKKGCVYINNSPLTVAVADENANCNCAYDRHIARLQQVEFISDCLPNGNYRNRQVWNGKIYCVDEDGFHYSNDPADCPVKSPTRVV